MKTQITQRHVMRTAAIAVVASVALIGGTSLADEGGDRGPQPEAPAGSPVTAQSGGAPGAESAPGTEAITTFGTNFDATILTKFIPARALLRSFEGSHNSLHKTAELPLRRRLTLNTEHARN